MKKLRFTVEMYEVSTDRDVALTDVARFDICQTDAWRILNQLEDAQRIANLPYAAAQLGQLNHAAGNIIGTGVNSIRNHP